jgi:hypothetical protein
MRLASAATEEIFQTLNHRDTESTEVSLDAVTSEPLWSMPYPDEMESKIQANAELVRTVAKEQFGVDSATTKPACAGSTAISTASTNPPRTT